MGCQHSSPSPADPANGQLMGSSFENFSASNSSRRPPPLEDDNSMLGCLYCHAEPLPPLQIDSLLRHYRQSGAPKAKTRPRAVCQELLVPTRPITDRQDGWFSDPHHGHGTGRPDAVRLGRSNNQPQPERRCLAILSHQFVSPGLAATLQICYRSLAIVFLEEKTALRPRNSRPLAAVCRTKSPRQIRESALVHRLRSRTRIQLASA